MTKRPGTSGDRDIYIPKHPTPAKGVPEVWEDVDTSQIEIVEERKAVRERRPTDKRLEKLEEHKDVTIAELGAIKVSIAKIEGRDETTSKSLANIEQYMAEQRHRERLEHAANVDVERAEKIDAIDARKAKRELLTKIIAGASAGGALLHYLLGRVL